MLRWWPWRALRNTSWMPDFKWKGDYFLHLWFLPFNFFLWFWNSTHYVHSTSWTKGFPPPTTFISFSAHEMYFLNTKEFSLSLTMLLRLLIDQGLQRGVCFSGLLAVCWGSGHVGWAFRRWSDAEHCHSPPPGCSAVVTACWHGSYSVGWRLCMQWLCQLPNLSPGLTDLTDFVRKKGWNQGRALALDG